MSKNKETTNAIIEKKDPLSARFVQKVRDEFTSVMSDDLAFTEHERKLTQNLYMYLDGVIKENEHRRETKGQSHVSPYKWENVNIAKLAVDAVHRVRLGLDALIPNHLHAVFYFNKKSQKYDVDLRIGYVGKLYMVKEMSLDAIKDIRIELVHKNDDFKAIMKNGLTSEETYEFDIKEPFNRGDVIGGFGYVMYDDSSKNKLILVDRDYLDKIRGTAQSDAFWKKWEKEMQFKTVAHRITEIIPLDPKKIHRSFYKVQEEDSFFRSNDKPERESLDIQPDALPTKEEAPLDISFQEEPDEKEPVTIKNLEQEAEGTAFDL